MNQEIKQSSFEYIAESEFYNYKYTLEYANANIEYYKRLKFASVVYYFYTSNGKTIKKLIKAFGIDRIKAIINMQANLTDQEELLIINIKNP